MEEILKYGVISYLLFLLFLMSYFVKRMKEMDYKYLKVRYSDFMNFVLISFSIIIISLGTAFNFNYFSFSFDIVHILFWLYILIFFISIIPKIGTKWDEVKKGLIILGIPDAYIIISLLFIYRISVETNNFFISLMIYVSFLYVIINAFIYLIEDELKRKDILSRDRIKKEIKIPFIYFSIDLFVFILTALIVNSILYFFPNIGV